MKKSVVNPKSFRENVERKIRDLVILDTNHHPHHHHHDHSETPQRGWSQEDDRNMVTNIEKSIYNYAIVTAGKKNIIKKWDNPAFTQLYIEKVRTILWNLDANRSLVSKLYTREIDARKMAFMTHQEFNPESWSVFIEDKRLRDLAKSRNIIEASTDKFTCSRCKTKRCTYYEMQTRSADEPVTIFITCIDCGKRWKN